VSNREWSGPPPDGADVIVEPEIVIETLELGVCIGVDVDGTSVLFQLSWINGAYTMKVSVTVLLIVMGIWR
jgi:hypothetical protein